MALPLTHLMNQLQVGREMSLLGDYSAAAVYFEGVLAGISKHTQTVADPYLKSQWSKAKRAVKEELDTVKEIEEIKSGFGPPGTSHPCVAGAGIQAKRVVHAHQDVPVEVLTPSDRRAHSFDDQPSVPDDPDVWRPPTSGPPGHNHPAPRAHLVHDAKLPAWARQNGGGGGGAAAAPSRRVVPPRTRPQVTSKVDSRWTAPKAGKEGKDGKPRYGGPDHSLAQLLEMDVLDSSPGVTWDDIAGLEDAKRVLEEAVVWPLWSPEMFVGIRRPPKGVLLFGPPGTGKTLLAKAVATECNTTFFNVSSATLASKYRGEPERMVRILFDLARHSAPSTIFIDEIDSLCSSRGGGNEHEASRRVKTEILVQIDGCNTGGEDGKPPPYVMVLAATNYPWDLDDALRRRMEKRIFISLPDTTQRRELLKISLRALQTAPDVDLDEVARQLAGYSGDDCSNVCRDAAMNGMRRIMIGKSREEIQAMNKSEISEPVCMDDFIQALSRIQPSVSADDVKKHEGWRDEFGSS